MSTDNHSDIMFKLGTIESKIDGIIARQDVANGRLGKHDTFLAELKSYQDRQSGEMKAWAIVASAIGTLIAIGATYLHK